MTLLWVALIFLAGALLLLSEFVLPGGILGLIGIFLLIGGCVWGMFTLPEYAVLILVLESAGTLLTIFAGMWLLANTRAGNALKLDTRMDAEAGYANMKTDTTLLGQTGMVVTPLRPAGTIELGDRRLDVTADGEFIPAGASVRVVSVNGNYIVVERAESAQAVE